MKLSALSLICLSTALISPAPASAEKVAGFEVEPVLSVRVYGGWNGGYHRDHRYHRRDDGWYWGDRRWRRHHHDRYGPGYYDGRYYRYAPDEGVYFGPNGVYWVW